MSKQKFVRNASFSFYEWRKRMGYTQVEAAHVVGLGTRTVTYYEQGRAISWPVYLACLYVERNKKTAECMADEYMSSKDSQE